jgi:hypothetical protein
MPTTPAHALRYPAATDPADVPSDMQKLASDVDVALLPADTVAAAGVRLIRNLLAASDAQPAFRIMGDGRHDWGAGGANAPDVNLYRGGVNVLRTESAFQVSRTDVGFDAIGTLLFGVDTMHRWRVYLNGAIWWGPGGSSNQDAALSRTGISELQILKNLRLDHAGNGTASSVVASAPNEQRKVKLLWGGVSITADANGNSSFLWPGGPYGGCLGVVMMNGNEGQSPGICYSMISTDGNGCSFAIYQGNGQKVPSGWQMSPTYLAVVWVS